MEIADRFLSMEKGEFVYQAEWKNADTTKIHVILDHLAGCATIAVRSVERTPSPPHYEPWGRAGAAGVALKGERLINSRD